MISRQSTLVLLALTSAAAFGCGGVDGPDAPALVFSDGKGGPNAVGGVQGSPPSGGAAPGSNSNQGGGGAGAGGSGATGGGTDAGTGTGTGTGNGTGTGQTGTIPGPAGPGGEAAPGGPPGQPATATGSPTVMDNVGESGNAEVPGFYGAGADIGLRVRPGP